MHVGFRPSTQPTLLFNGNFDAIAPGWNTAGSNQLIPGWSFDSNAKQQHLERVNKPNNSSLALKLDGGLNSITHNPFLVTDWGALRFDLYAPTTGGTLEVTLKEVGNPLNTKTQTIYLEDAVGPYNLGYNELDTYRLGYARTGFETFHVDVPDSLRGKIATLEFKVNGGTVYLDDVFFKSESLLLGNPSNARYTPTNPSIYANNYLVERPQYTLSYNDSLKGPNWVSWILDSSWLGKAIRPDLTTAQSVGYPGSYLPNSPYSADAFDYPWLSDPMLPSEWVKTASPDYRASLGLDKGHLAPVDDRTRSVKDVYSTFFTSNVLPQYRDANRFGAWRQFERYTNESLAASGNQLYITAGGVGYGYNPRQSGYPYKTVFNTVLVKDGIVQTDSNNRPVLANSLPKDSSGNPREGYSLQAIENEKLISVPEYLWKIALVLEPEKTLSDVNSQTRAIAIITPNRSQLQSSGSVALPNGVEKNISNWNDWQEWQVSVDYLEEITGLDFFSELPDTIEQAIEGRNPYSAALQAESGQNLLHEIGIGVSDNSSVRPDSLIPDTIHKVGIVKNSSSEISSIYGGESEASILEIAVLKNSLYKDGFLEDGSLQVGIAQFSSHQISKSKISPAKDSSLQISTTQIGAVQIDPAQINSLQIGTRNSDSWFESYITEISLPSSITLQQFLSSHNFNLQNTTIPTWTEFLTGTTPFNLNIEIADLPTSQLAEANITRFDPTGRPTSGTLTLDTDANGLGWFIDNTPWEKLELGTRNSELGTRNYISGIVHSSHFTLHTSKIGISNGQFDQLLQDWQTRGDTKQLNGQAILREGDPRLANLSQTFGDSSTHLYPSRL